jgi:sugar phosphate isomerase/epimerase
LLAWLPAGAGEFSRDLYVFDNGTGRDQKLPLRQQAALLRKTGYTGMGLFTGTARIPEVLDALDAEGLRLVGIYVQSFVDDTAPRIEAGLAAAIERLKGRETMIVLTLRGHGANAEQRAIENVRTVADLAARAGLRVCLYPHINFYVETTPDAIRIARASGRKNVGVALNLYHTVVFHETRCGGQDFDLSHLVAQSLPHLFLASINGIGRKDDHATIERLGEGAYDVARFLGVLRQAGYAGPVSLQAYRIPGDIEENLTRSMRAWRAMVK